jgi:hypothetical protein
VHADVRSDAAPGEFGGDLAGLGVEDNLRHEWVPFAAAKYSASVANSRKLTACPTAVTLVVRLHTK